MKTDKKELRRINILTKPLLPLLIKMSIPTIIGMLVSVTYNLTDTFFIGLLGNKSMTAAIGIIFSFVSIIQAVGFWFGYGSGNVMSKKIGEKNENEAEIISSLGIILAIITGILISLVASVFVEPLAFFLGGSASQSLLVFTTDYLKVIAISIPFTLYAITVYNQLRLCGNPKDGMVGLLAGMLSNIILDPIFIFGFNMGFIGVGYATLTGHIIASVLLTILSRKNGNIPVTLNRAKLSKERLYHILVGGAPNFSRQAITSLSLVLLNIVAATYSESLIAALTVNSRLIAFAIMIMVGWGQGFQPICAMNYGAKNYDRVKNAYKITVGIGFVFLSIFAIILFVFADTLISYLSKNQSVIDRGAKLLRIQTFTLPLFSILATSSMFMQNVGNYFSALIISTSRQGTIYIPLLIFLPMLFGEFGIYIVQPMADIISLVPTIIIIKNYLRKQYSKNIDKKR